MLLVGVDGLDVLAADVGVLGVDRADVLAAGGGVLGLDGEVVCGEEILSSGQQLVAGSVQSLVILFPAMLWVSNVDLRSSTTLALK